MGSVVLLDLMGGVALLLWGLHMVHSGILRAFGPDLRQLLGCQTAKAKYCHGAFADRGAATHQPELGMGGLPTRRTMPSCPTHAFILG